MIVEASVEELVAQASFLTPGPPLLTACQTLGHRDPTLCLLPITPTARNHHLRGVIEIATSILPLKQIPRRPTLRRQTLSKILVIQIAIPSPAITPTPVPCPTATAQQDSIIHPVDAVALGACLNVVAAQSERSGGAGSTTNDCPPVKVTIAGPTHNPPIAMPPMVVGPGAGFHSLEAIASLHHNFPVASMTYGGPPSVSGKSDNATVNSGSMIEDIDMASIMSGDGSIAIGGGIGCC